MKTPSIAIKFLLVGMEQSINKALGLDLATQHQLSSLGRQCIEITITDWNKTVYVLLQEGRVELLTYWEEEIDCEIKCSLKTLYNLISKDDDQIRFHPDAVLSGNSDLLLSLYKIITAVEPDYEAALCHWLGPIVSHQIGRKVRSGIKWADAVFKSIADDLQLYIHEESMLFPHPIEVAAFNHDISRLESEVERLSKAISKLASNQHDLDESAKTTDQQGSSTCD